MVTSTETPSLAPGLKSLDEIKLRGITRTASRRFALINNRSFEAGEQGDLKTTEGKLRIKCVEIKDRSVIIVIIGETQERELHLNEKL